MKTRRMAHIYIHVAQTVAIEELSEIKFDKSLKDEVPCDPSMQTAYRSGLGQINWLQSRTQFHICYKFSRCASRAAAPTIGDVRAINKIVRTIRAQSLSMKFWPLYKVLVGFLVSQMLRIVITKTSLHNVHTLSDYLSC